jgi:hypothetical protein
MPLSGVTVDVIVAFWREVLSLRGTWIDLLGAFAQPAYHLSAFVSGIQEF